MSKISEYFPTCMGQREGNRQTAGKERKGGTYDEVSEQVAYVGMAPEGDEETFHCRNDRVKLGLRFMNSLSVSRRRHRR